MTHPSAEQTAVFPCGSTVCGAIILYYPRLDELRHNLEALCGQVSKIVLIENASKSELAIRQLAIEFDAHLVQNPDNLGIATALNQAAAFAMRLSTDYLLLLDQDSRVEPGFVERQLAVFARFDAYTTRLAVVCPLVVNIANGFAEGPLCAESGRPLLAQTSGSLISTIALSAVGEFREEFFIDYVDYEFCLRLHAAGWAIAFEPTARLLHQPGRNVAKRAVGKTWYTADAAPDRHYYMVRNFVRLAKERGSKHPKVFFKLLAILIKIGLKAQLWEERRREKMWAWLQGLKHGWSGRMGPR